MFDKIIIGDSMEKEIFVKYVEMLHRFEKLSEEEMSIYSTPEEEEIVFEVRSLIEKNPILLDLLKQIHASPDNERMNVVNKHFSNKEKEVEKTEKTEEEEIAKTFGVNVENIEHHFLSNGNEIFSFYDSNLGRQVIIENNKKGKSLFKYLKEIQDQNVQKCAGQ